MRASLPRAAGSLADRLAWSGLSVRYHDARDLVAAMARTVTYLYAAGGALVLLSLPLVAGNDANLVAIALIAGTAVATGAFHLLLFDRLPLRAFQGSGLFATALVTTAIAFAGGLGPTYALFYFWVVLYAFFFYELGAAAVQLAAIAAGYSVLVLFAGDTVGPVHALVMLATLTVAGLIVLFVKNSLLRVIESLEVSEARVRELFENADDLAYTLGLDARFTSVNRAFERLTGYTREELIGRSMTEIVPPELAEFGLGQLTRKVHAPDVVTRYECTLLAKSGEEILVEIVSRIVAGADGRPVGVQGIARDIRERKRFERELAVAEQRFRTLVQNASDVISVVDRDTIVRYQTPGVAVVLGYAAEELVGKPLTELVHPDDRDALAELCRSAAALPGAADRHELRFRRRDGRWCYLEVVARNELEDPAIAGVVLTGHDVTGRKQLERQLTEQAFRDALTGLPNRALFLDRLGQALERRSRDGTDIAVLFLDLDDFKTVNDSFGHVPGDRLLVETGKRLRRSIRRPDTTARLGGDEFAILVERVGQGGVAAVAERVLGAFDAPFRLEGVEIAVHPSIGIAVASGGGEEVDANEVLRRADVAMYRAKADATRRYAVFEPQMHASALKRLERKGRLERALVRDELEVHYQPVLAVKDGTLAGVEALARWRDPLEGLVAPSDLIPLAEESGLIVSLGDMVLRTAARQARAWQEQDGAPAFTLRVNLSARQLQDPEVVARIAAALAESGLPGSRLLLELTETVLMHDVEETIGRLEELRALGIGLALDDYGTGYSSLAYLKSLPLQELKLARPFVLNIGNAEDRAIVRSTVQLGRNLGLRVLAEGVESEAVWRAVQAIGCDLGQGDYLGRPVPAAELDPRRIGARASATGLSADTVFAA